MAPSGLPSPVNSGGDARSFGRARARWLLIGLALVSGFFLLFTLGATPEPGGTRIGRLQSVAGKWNPFSSSASSYAHASAGDAQYLPGEKWVNGSGRVGLNYNSRFNPDDLTLCGDECDALFPGLYKEIDRSVKFFTEKQV